MTEENLNQDQEVEETTPDTGSESEELDSIFDDESESNDLEESDKIAELEKRIADMQKGLDKKFSDEGRQKKEADEKEEPKKDDSGINPVIKSLYFKANPEAQEVWDEVVETAKSTGKDPFELYEGSAYFKGEAKAKAEARDVEEKSKSKISKPSSKTGFSKNLVNVKEDDIGKLSREERLEWITLQAKKEQNQID